MGVFDDILVEDMCERSRNAFYSHADAPVSFDDTENAIYLTMVELGLLGGSDERIRHVCGECQE